MKLIITAVVIAVLPISLSAGKCRCREPEEAASTRRGGNETIVFRERGTYGSLDGVVVGPNAEPVPDTLVEVFTNPEHLLLSYPENVQKRKEQRRIAVCETGPDGRFCFRHIPPGKYELRASVGSAWNVSHVYVVVAPRSRKSKRTGLKVLMTLGT